MKESWREAWIIWLLLGLQFRKQAFGFRFRELSFPPVEVGMVSKKHFPCTPFVREIDLSLRPTKRYLFGWDATPERRNSFEHRCETEKMRLLVAGCFFLWYEYVWIGMKCLAFTYWNRHTGKKRTKNLQEFQFSISSPGWLETPGRCYCVEVPAGIMGLNEGGWNVLKSLAVP